MALLSLYIVSFVLAGIAEGVVDHRSGHGPLLCVGVYPFVVLAF